MKILNNLDDVAEKLDNEIVVFPTDTLYGLLTNSYNKRSVEKIYKLKKRDEDKPLLLLVDTLDKVKNWILIENWHYFFIEEWPAPLTLIFKVKKEFKEELNYLHRGKDKIAIRIPRNERLLNLLKKVKFPVVAPSANYQGMKPAKNIKEAYEYFKDDVYYYDGGNLEGLPSTIIDLSEFPPKIIREGKYKLKWVYFKFYGHKNIKATHKYTFEITKEEFLTEKGDCIIGVKGFSNKEFQNSLKSNDFKKIRFFIFSKNYDSGIAYFLKNEDPSSISFVVRRSKFKDNRTGLIKSNKTASSINRKLIEDLKKEKEAYILFKEVTNNKLFIDGRSLISNLDFLPKRLKKRIEIKKEEDFYDRDFLYILKKEKMIQNLKIINKEIIEKKLINQKIINNLKNLEKDHNFEFEDFYLLKRSEFLNNEVYNFIKKELEKIFEKRFHVVELKEINKKNYKKELNKIGIDFKSAVFSNNEYLLKLAKKANSTTISEKDKYFVDYVLNFK